MTKNNTKLIEFVCTHNHGRSPIAEAFAKQYLEQRKCNDYQPISSGSEVDKVNAMLAGEIAIPDEYVTYGLNLGLKRDLPNVDKKTIERLLKETDLQGEEIQRIVRSMQTQFVQEEHDYRTSAFKKFGLGKPKQVHDQIIARPDTKLVLGMGKRNVEVIKNIYDADSNSPIIDTLAGYALDLPGQEFVSEFGGSYQDYLNMAEEIRGFVHKAIDRSL